MAGLSRNVSGMGTNEPWTAVTESGQNADSGDSWGAALQRGLGGSVTSVGRCLHAVFSKTCQFRRCKSTFIWRITCNCVFGELGVLVVTCHHRLMDDGAKILFGTKLWKKLEWDIAKKLRSWNAKACDVHSKMNFSYNIDIELFRPINHFFLTFVLIV